MAAVKRTAGPGKAKLEMLKQLAKLQADVGYFPSNKYEDGTPVAYIAAIQEMGYPEGGIPPRSFMRTTAAEKQSEWKDKTVSMVKNMNSAPHVMELIGGMAAGDMRAKIAEINEPELTDATKRARRARGNSSTKPLVDTRILQPTLTHQVKK